MRSLYVRILVASLLTVVVSLAAFSAVTRRVIGEAVAGMVTKTYAIQVEQAAGAWQHGGAAELGAFLAVLNGTFGVEHRLTDANGTDLVDGSNQRASIDTARSRPNGMAMANGRFVLAEASHDGRYWMVVSGTPPFSMWSFVPFYVITLASVIFISWLAAVSIASPLRKVAGAVDRFGGGDLTARASYTRRNEIGHLSASFNRMADRLQTLLTAERRLLQDISHELRSPLARLSFAAELARTAPDRDAAIDRVVVEVDRLSKLVGELVEITRAEGDATARRRLTVDLERLLADIVASAELQAQARGCRIVLTGSPAPSILGDQELLRRAIENIVNNALRYAPAGSDVEIFRAGRGAHVIIAVRDSGPGVPGEHLTRIFEPFYRIDGSRQEATGGVGLGLSIAARAVRVHHGDIRAEHASPGLSVTIELPIEAGTDSIPA